jgi:choline-glycine betaine transporter
MTETTAILVFTVLALGAYNWHLHTIIQGLNEQLNNFMDMVMEMAKELQELGSPNVKVLHDKEKEGL